MTDKSDNVIPPEFRFLQEECGFRVAFRGNSCIQLVGGDLRISFDRGRYGNEPLGIHVGSVHDEQKEGNWDIWFSVQWIMWLVGKAEPGEYPSDTEMADFLYCHMPMVRSMFSSNNLKETKAASDRLSAELGRKAEKAVDRARRGRRLTNPPGWDK
jgi:hypothetical protein